MRKTVEEIIKAFHDHFCTGEAAIDGYSGKVLKQMVETIKDYSGKTPYKSVLDCLSSLKQSEKMVNDDDIRDSELQKASKYNQQEEDIQVITATNESVEIPSKVGSDEFVAKLMKELNTGKLWRSLSSLATQLHVDAVELDCWLGRNQEFIRKPGKEDGVFYYCFTPRFNREVSLPNEKKKEESKLVVREEDRYALAMLHMVYWQMWKTMKTYALEVNERDEEAFKFFTSALDKLESGLVLFSGKTKANVDKLPRFS